MRPNPQETVDLVTFTEEKEILNGKLHFLCSEMFKKIQMMMIIITRQSVHSK